MQTGSGDFPFPRDWDIDYSMWHAVNHRRRSIISTVDINIIHVLIRVNMG